MLFLPFTQDYVKKGFEFLSTSTPEWFTHIILISVSASYGIRVGKGAVGILSKKDREWKKTQVSLGKENLYLAGLNVSDLEDSIYINEQRTHRRDCCASKVLKYDCRA